MVRKPKRSSSKSRNSRLAIEMLEPRQLLSANPLISEFMASNTKTLVDYYGKYPDWLEIYNPDTAAVDLVQLAIEERRHHMVIPRGREYRFTGVFGRFLRRQRHGGPQRRIAHQLQARSKRRLLGAIETRQYRGFGIFARVSAADRRCFLRREYFISRRRRDGQCICSDGRLAWNNLARRSANEPFYDSDWTSGTIGAGYGSTTPIGSANMVLRLNANTASTLTTDTTNRRFEPYRQRMSATASLGRALDRCGDIADASQWIDAVQCGRK